MRRNLASHNEHKYFSFSDQYLYPIFIRLVLFLCEERKKDTKEKKKRNEIERENENHSVCVCVLCLDRQNPLKTTQGKKEKLKKHEKKLKPQKDFIALTIVLPELSVIAWSFTGYRR